MIHQNSMKAWIEGQKEFSARSKTILTLCCRLWSEEHKWKAATDREICSLLNLPDMNCVRPRITELVKAGWLAQHYNVTDEVTGKKVRTVAPSLKLRAAAAPVGQGELL
jgi:hypothetical protein